MPERNAKLCCRSSPPFSYWRPPCFLLFWLSLVPPLPSTPTARNLGFDERLPGRCGAYLFCAQSFSFHWLMAWPSYGRQNQSSWLGKTQLLRSLGLVSWFLYSGHKAANSCKSGGGATSSAARSACVSARRGDKEARGTRQPQKGKVFILHRDIPGYREGGACCGYQLSRAWVDQLRTS